MVLFIHSLNKHLLNYKLLVYSSILDARKAAGNETYRICHHRICILVGETANEQVKRCIYNVIFRSTKSYAKDSERGEREIDCGKVLGKLQSIKIIA